METSEAIRTLLAVREYTDQPVASEIVTQVVEAGHLSASSQNKQPWHFTVVQSRDALKELAAQCRSGPYIASAAFAIVVTVTPTGPAVSDASRAIQSMMLAAWAQGVGSNWVGVPKDGSEQNVALRNLLAMPEEQQFVAILPFGYPAQSIGKGIKQRKPLTEVASSERFDTPYDA